MLGSKQIGSEAQSGVTFQARGSLNCPMIDDWILRFEIFSRLGTTGKFNGLSNQTQRVGPAIVGNLRKWQEFASDLRGVTDNSPDSNFRFDSPNDANSTKPSRPPAKGRPSKSVYGSKRKFHS